MDADEKLALKRSCEDLIYKATKEATSKIMLLEEKSLLFQRELQLAKEESFQMQLKLQQMMDSKISESELRSLSQQRKIDVLEAQLQEAEDIVYDLRAELRKIQAEPERVSCSKEKEVMNLQDHDTATPGELPETSREVANMNRNVDPSEMSQRSSSETAEQDMGFAEISDDELESVEATGVHDAINEHEGLMGKMDLSGRETRSTESLEIPAYRTDTDNACDQFFINNLCNRLLNSKSMEPNVNSGIPSQPLNDITVKYKFQRKRKRKRDLCRVYENASVDKSSTKKTNKEKLNSFKSSVMESSEDSGQIAEVAQQVDMNPSNFRESEMGSTSKTVKHADTPPGALARGREQSFSASGSLRRSTRQRTLISKSKNCNAATSNQNELAQDNGLVPPGFGPIEVVPLPLEAEVIQNTQRSETSPCESKKTRRGRGKTKCRIFERLEPGEKLSVTFYNNRVVGEHYATFVRYLGMLIRNRNMCPLRVHSWADIEEDKLELMWQAVIDKFDSDDMNDQRYHVLQHMRNLWNKWRAALHMNVKSKPLHEALKDVPKGVDKGDWEWLVKERFFNEKFMEASTRNSVNRSKSTMPSRTGSKPIREIIYELVSKSCNLYEETSLLRRFVRLVYLNVKGGKDGNLPDMATIFFETHKKDNKLVESETNEKYAKIQELVQSEPSLTNIEVVERCFGPQSKSHVVGFGGGITVKELKGGKTSKAAKLEKLNASEKKTNDI